MLSILRFSKRLSSESAIFTQPRLSTISPSTLPLLFLARMLVAEARITRTVRGSLPSLRSSTSVIFSSTKAPYCSYLSGRPVISVQIFSILR